MTSSPTPTVAIFNASDDTLEMLTTCLSQRGYRALNGYADVVKSGEFDFVTFMTMQKPEAVIWDIAPPYDRNWNFFKLLRTSHLFDHCRIILTTTHKEHLNRLAGQDTGAIEIIGKPYDLEMIVDAVTRALERRDNSGPRAVGNRRDE